MTHIPTVTIREATPADYAAIARVVSTVTPQHPMTAETLAHQVKVLTESPLKPHLQDWVAELGGEVVGQAVVYQSVGMFHPDRYNAEVMVIPRAQGYGIGTALANVLEAHLQERGAKEIEAGAYEDDPMSLRFLIDRDFTETMRFFDNVLTLEGFDFAPWQAQMQMPEGLRALSLAQFKGEVGQEKAVQAFYGGFSEARLDVPRTGEATELPFETFVQRTTDPNHYPEGVWLAVNEAGDVVALTELWKNDAEPERLDIGLTGTRQAWRRRGLGLALKLRAMQVAQAAGYRELWTGNAGTNAPMLALNERLGFKPRPAYISFKRGSVE